jgi:hypothetical protein
MISPRLTFNHAFLAGQNMGVYGAFGVMWPVFASGRARLRDGKLDEQCDLELCSPANCQRESVLLLRIASCAIFWLNRSAASDFTTGFWRLCRRW